MTPYSLSTADLCTAHLQFIPVAHLDLIEMCPPSPLTTQTLKNQKLHLGKGMKTTVDGEPDAPQCLGLSSHCPPPPLCYSRMILCRCWKAMDHTELFCLFIGRTSAICVWESSLINVRFPASCYCQSGWETWQVHGQKCDVEIPCI